MRRFISFIAVALAIVVSSCSKFDDSDIWNKLNEHEKRIVALEELCKQMNTNISSLQSIVNALQKNDHITNVSPVRKDGEEIGYTITFAYGDTITIYHGTNGKDGANGKDGKDGYTPQIGVMKDTDGIYYWTVDGEWLLDGKGNKIQANGINGTNGTNGSNGQDGKDGNDGANGITPRLKIENDYWYVSYDNGATWTELGKATSEDETNGNTIFSSITQDDEYVYFNIADGTMITLPKHDKENIQFEDLQVKAICCANWDTNNDGELSYAEAAAVTDIGTIFKGNTNIIAFTELKYFTGITEIPSSAFYDCSSLWKIIIPANIVTIADNAFYNCDLLTNVTIPDSVTSIDANAFNGCISLPVIDNIRYADTCLVQAVDKSLTSYSIKAGTRFIGSGAFLDCSSLTSITIPDSVTSIGRSAFSYCDSLTSVTIPDSVTSIEQYAFYDCDSLTSVTIGNSVTSIKQVAFAHCDSLKEVYCKPTTPPSLSSDGFNYLLSSAKIYVPSESVDIYKSATGWKTRVNQIVGYDFN
ncbi:MAG: leucine-rich repeat protein [Alistipes sp.]|nr:leucine-rich repeat protein [Alistipes sp.]